MGAGSIGWATAFAAVWDHAADAMALLDPDGIVLRTNPAYYALYGLAPEDVLSRSFAAIFPEVARVEAEAQYRAVFAAAAIAPTYEAAVRRGDGAEQVVEARYTFLEEGGHRVAMLSTVRDITEHRASEASRLDGEARRQLGLDAAAMGRFVWRVGEDTARLDARLRALRGLPLGGTTAHWAAIRAAIHPGDWDRGVAATGGAIVSPGGGELREDVRVCPAGDERWLSVMARAHVEGDPEGAIRVTGTVAEITGRKRAEADRERLLAAEGEARALTEAMVRGRDEFLATAAHELRAPLARLRLAAQLLHLGDTVPAAEQGETLATIERASIRFEVLVRDLTDLARLRTGHLALRLATVDLATLIAEAVAEARARDGACSGASSRRHHRDGRRPRDCPLRGPDHPLRDAPWAGAGIDQRRTAMAGRPNGAGGVPT